MAARGTIFFGDAKHALLIDAMCRRIKYGAIVVAPWQSRGNSSTSRPFGDSAISQIEYRHSVIYKTMSNLRPNALAA